MKDNRIFVATGKYTPIANNDNCKTYLEVLIWDPNHDPKNRLKTIICENGINVITSNNKLKQMRE